MSSGRKVLLGLGIFYVLALGSVFLLTRIGSTDQADTDPGEVTTETETLPATGPPPADPPTPYEVQAGDTLNGIAQRFDVSTEMILEENDLDDPDALVEGQVLMIPSRPPVWLEITPASTTVSQGVELTLTGARPGETVTFEIDSPAGLFTGPPHTASEDGTVSTTYRPGIAAPPGTYTVTANGNEGTTAEATFQADPTPDP